MKKMYLLVALSTLWIYRVKAQTADELVGKWKLIKWTTQNGKEKTVEDSTFQVFKDNHKFISISGGKEHNGK